MMNVLIWGIVALASLVAEIATRVRVALCIFLAALICVPVSLFAENPALEIALFLLLSCLSLCLRFVFTRPKRMKADEGLDEEKIVGSRCRVTERIDNAAGSGQAKCHGLDFAARALDDDDVFEAGNTVTVVALEGVRLVCKRA